MKTFIDVSAQYDNLGDVLIRRSMLAILSNVEELHIYARSAPQDYLDALYIPPGAIVHSSRRTWLNNLLTTSGRIALVFGPGEVRLTGQRAPQELLWLIITACVRFRGGVALRVGKSVRNVVPLTRFIHAVSVRTCTDVYWRDDVSRQVIGCGHVIPDVGFARYPSLETAQRHSRRFLTITMRSDRLPPSDEYVQAVREFAQKYSLTVQIVSQVERDDRRSAELASRLNCDFIRKYSVIP